MTLKAVERGDKSHDSFGHEVKRHKNGKYNGETGFLFGSLYFTGNKRLVTTEFGPGKLNDQINCVTQ